MLAAYTANLKQNKSDDQKYDVEYKMVSSDIFQSN